MSLDPRRQPTRMPFAMRFSHAARVATATIAILSVVATSSYVLADASAGGDGDAVVVKVGSQKITTAQIEKRVAMLPPFQLRYFGKTLDEIRRKFVEEAIVKEALYVEGAQAEKIPELPEVSDKIRSVLRNAMLKQIRSEVASTGSVTDEEIRAYYDANKDKYHAPMRIALWRILVATREEALGVIAKAKTDLSPKRWNELAREVSLDKSTNMRGGNLGFVAPDGSTNDANIKVDLAVLHAAEAVKDAELVQEPVQEGSQWAVVWRRQTSKAIDRPVELETPSIRQILTHEREQKRVAELVAELRKKDLSDTHADLLDLLEISGTGDVSPIKRPGTLPTSRHTTPADPGPKETPAGKR